MADEIARDKAGKLSAKTLECTCAAKRAALRTDCDSSSMAERETVRPSIASCRPTQLSLTKTAFG